jgi:hypothetical protein
MKIEKRWKWAVAGMCLCFFAGLLGPELLFRYSNYDAKHRAMEERLAEAHHWDYQHLSKTQADFLYNEATDVLNDDGVSNRNESRKP